MVNMKNQKRACAPVRYARRPCACLSFTYHRGVYIYPCGSKVNSAYGSGGMY